MEAEMSAVYHGHELLLPPQTTRGIRTEGAFKTVFGRLDAGVYGEPKLV
jgi:hypothetical protein